MPAFAYPPPQEVKEMSEVYEKTFGDPLYKVATNLGICQQTGDILGLAFHVYSLEALAEMSRNALAELRQQLDQSNLN